MSENLEAAAETPVKAIAKPPRPRQRMPTKISRVEATSADDALNAALAKPFVNLPTKAVFSRLRPKIIKLKSMGYTEKDIVDILKPVFAGMTVPSLKYLLKEAVKVEVPPELANAVAQIPASAPSQVQSGQQGSGQPPQRPQQGPVNGQKGQPNQQVNPTANAQQRQGQGQPVQSGQARPQQF